MNNSLCHCRFCLHTDLSILTQKPSMLVSVDEITALIHWVSSAIAVVKRIVCWPIEDHWCSTSSDLMTEIRCWFWRKESWCWMRSRASFLWICAWDSIFYHLSYDYLEEALKQSYKNNVKTNEFLIVVPVAIVMRLH